MPRLHDRLLAQGSKPITGRDLILMTEGHDTRQRSTLAEHLRTFDRVTDPTDQEITAAIERSRASQRAHRSRDSAPTGWPILAKAQVIIDDEVDHHLNTFPDGIQLSTLLITPVVPPFPHVFVDFRGVPNPYGSDEFGFLPSTLRGDEGWTIYGSLYG